MRRLEACYFDALKDGRWSRLARVLSHTAAEHCPGWRLNVMEGGELLPPRVATSHSSSSNTTKLEHWARVIDESADGDEVLLIDADVMILRPLDPAWDRPFDLAYTTRAAKYPFNCGVMFVRASAAVRAFFADWVRINRRMLMNPTFHHPWRERFAGLNQSAFGYLLEEGRTHGLTLAQLPCLEWNCEDSSWASFDPDVTRIVHIKSALRAACLERQPVPPELAMLSALWKGLDRQFGHMSRTA